MKTLKKTMVAIMMSAMMISVTPITTFACESTPVEITETQDINYNKYHDPDYIGSADDVGDSIATGFANVCAFLYFIIFGVHTVG